jgi:hypothetical protein
MLVSILVRRLRPGVTFAQFKAAWLAESGYMSAPGHVGAPVRVTHARRVDDDREIVSYAFLDMTRDQLLKATAGMAEPERRRHDRLDAVVESTVVKGIYEVIDVTDLT